jgi:hypothetical protein
MMRTLAPLAFLLLLSSAPPRDAVTVAQGATQPHLAIGEKGEIYAVFISGGNTQFSISTDKGKTFSRPVVAIDGGGKVTGGCQRSPRVGVDAKGTIYVTDPLARHPDLVLAVSTDGGKTFSNPVVVNDAPKQNEEALHWLAVSPGGDVHVAWLDRRLRGNNPGKDLAYAKVTDQGKRVHKNVMLQGPICECCAPGLATDAKGNPVLVYREGGKQSNRQVFIAISPNGGTSFPKVARLNQGESKVDG